MKIDRSVTEHIHRLGKIKTTCYNKNNIHIHHPSMKKILFVTAQVFASTGAIILLEFNILPVDKTKHVLVCLVLFVALFSFRLLFRKHSSESVALLLSFRDVLIIGVLKELFDMAGFGTPEVKDLVADLVGVTIPFFGLLCAEIFGIGSTTHAYISATKPRSFLDQLMRNEEHYIVRQWKTIAHEGWRLMLKV